MLSFAPGTKVYLACQPIDMRKGMDGLVGQVTVQLQQDPFCGHLFVFRGKSGDRMKLIYCDGTGLCLFAKRFEHGKFVWPPVVDECLSLTSAQLALLLEGIDWRRTLRTEEKATPVAA